MTPPTALPQAVDVLTDQSVPFPLRALSIDGDGRIVRRDHQDAHFGFALAGTKFRARARECPHGIEVLVEADLAPLPFTAESAPARQALRELAEEARLSTGRLFVVDHRTLALTAQIAVPGPVTPVDVVSAVIPLLLELRPYLTRIAELSAGSRLAGAA